MGQTNSCEEKNNSVEEDPEAELRAAKEAFANKWKTYEWHHPPDLTEVNEPCFPLKSRCRILKVSNVGALEDAEGKTFTFNEGSKEEGAVKPDEHVLRLVCMSDTHSDAMYWIDNGLVPDGDIFLFAGDMTGKGCVDDLKSFVEFIKRLPHKHKVVIAGNHDLVLDQEYYEQAWNVYHKTKEPCPDEVIAQLKEACSYLVDETIEIDGLRIFGSPRSPEFGTWAFPVFPDDIRYWDRSLHKACGTQPVDVVMTHGPVPGHGSLCANGADAGDKLLDETLKTKYIPALSVAGHIHEGYGCTKDDETGTVFVNVSSLDRFYRKTNRCVVVDIAVPN